MKKPENNWIEGMLLDEYNQSLMVIDTLKRKLQDFPKGKLYFRQKENRKLGKSYSYAFLKFYENHKSVARHVPKVEVDSVKQRIEERDKIISQMNSYKERAKYIEKILKIRRNKDSHSSHKAGNDLFPFCAHRRKTG